MTILTNSTFFQNNTNSQQDQLMLFIDKNRFIQETLNTQYKRKCKQCNMQVSGSRYRFLRAK